jgi:hypothetical protein
MSNLSKRMSDLEKAYSKVLASNYLTAVIIRTDEDLKQHKGNIGPDTQIIKIVARKEKVSNE